MSSHLQPSAKGDRWYAPSWRMRRKPWRRILWFLIFPQANHRTGLTVSGFLLVIVAMGIGSAAYNSANNILFLTLALLLGCLVMSGVLSWQNFRGLRWRLEVPMPVRAGQDHTVALFVQNGKKFTPSYGVWFELEAGSSNQTMELFVRSRLEPGSEMRLETTFRPTRRGRDTVRLNYVGSLFPFGFLRKSFSVDLVESFLVWPAPIEYQRFGVALWQRSPTGLHLQRAGQGGDLLSLRRYQRDDSHRQIHWKASARLRQLMVRQTAVEAGEGFSLWLDTSPGYWSRPEQFELACSFAATLAADLFKADKLRAAGVGQSGMLPIRRLSDLERFFDALALADCAPKTEATVRSGGTQPLHTLEVMPDGVRGVAAFCHGEKAAAA